MRDVSPLPGAAETSGRMLDKIHDAVLVYNPACGRGRRRRQRDVEEAAAILRDAGILAELAATKCPGAAEHLARDAVRDGRQLVIVCGGDGTINEAVNALAGSKVALAVLPAGTANILAKELRIPTSIPEAAQRIVGGRLARIALGEIVPRENENGGATSSSKRRFFLCAAGAGPDAAIIHAVDTQRKQRLGILAYWQEGFRQFFTYKFPQFRVVSREWQTTASLVVVGRTKHYGGPFRITTGASLFEDSFEVLAYNGRNRLGLLLCMPAIWLGCLRRVPRIHIWKTTELACEAAEALEVFSQVDGEAAAALPLQFRIVPDALTLALPAERPA